MRLFLKYLVFIFCSTFIEGVKFRCDYRYTKLGWFKYHEMPATWNNARLQCYLEGAILASPTSDEMKSIMLQSFCKPEIYIGISDIFNKGFYYSIDGIPLSEIPHEWAKFEPDNKNDAENCLILNTEGKFSDVKCNDFRPYICYRNNFNGDFNICGTSDAEYRFENKTNKCYKFHIRPETFAKAKFKCFAEGGHLAIINSEEEAKVMVQISDKYPAEKMPGSFNKDYALVGFQWDESTEWTTIHGQPIQNAGFAKFAPGEPSGSEFCGSIHRKNGLLNDIFCNIKYAFICEKSPNYPAICDSAKNETYPTPVCDNDVQDDEKESKCNSTSEENTGPVY